MEMTHPFENFLQIGIEVSMWITGMSENGKPPKKQWYWDPPRNINQERGIITCMRYSTQTFFFEKCANGRI